MSARDGRRIALSVDPNTSNDVCTFCRHAIMPDSTPVCDLGFTPYFRSLSNMGPIWVSDCGAGQLRPELAAAAPPISPRRAE
jgi:hypothetical protein